MRLIFKPWLHISEKYFKNVENTLSEHQKLRKKIRKFSLKTAQAKKKNKKKTGSNVEKLRKLEPHQKQRVLIKKKKGSHARSVALKAGIQEDLVGRVDQVFEEMVKGLPASMPDSLLNLEDIHQLVSCFLDVDIGKEEETHLFTERLADMKV